MRYIDNAARRPAIGDLPKRAAPLLIAALVLLGAICTTHLANAQIINQIDADITHAFVIGNTTLPPGKYTFRMLPDSDLSAMTVTSADGKHSVEFLVRESQANHTPQHSELVFACYGQKEFLTRVLEQGSKIGVAVAELSRQELRLQKQGQHPVEQTESSQGT